MTARDPWTRVDALLLAVAALLLFWGLGSNSLHNEDEARYAVCAQEMLRTGDFVSPQVGGEPWWNKAPLQVWAAAALGAVAGVDEWTVRIPSALSGLAVVALMLAIGRRLFDAGSARWAALVMLTSTQFVYQHCARTGEMDALLLACWTAAVWAALATEDDPRWWVAVGALVGACGMAKHAIYAVPPLALLLIWGLASGSLRRASHRTLFASALASILVLAPWHVAMSLRYGEAFWSSYLGVEVGQRVAVDYSAHHWYAFYLSVIKDGLFPWSLLLPFAVASRSWRVDRPTTILLALWAGGVLAGVILAQLELHWYALPALPPLALITGCWLARARISGWVLGALAVLLALSPSNAGGFNPFDTRAIGGWVEGDLLGVLQGARPWLVQVACALVALAGAIMMITGRSRSGRRLALGGWALFALLQVAWPLRWVGTRSDLDRLVVRVRESAPPSARYVAVLDDLDAESDLVRFALGRLGGPVERVSGEGSIDDTRWVLERRESLPGSVEGRALVVGEWAARPPLDGDTDPHPRNDDP